MNGTEDIFGQISKDSAGEGEEDVFALIARDSAKKPPTTLMADILGVAKQVSSLKEIPS